MSIELRPAEAGDVTLLQMDGRMTGDEFRRALELAKEGCQQIYEVQRRVLVDRYGTIGGPGSCDAAEAEEEI